MSFCFSQDCNPVQVNNVQFENNVLQMLHLPKLTFEFNEKTID